MTSRYAAAVGRRRRTRRARRACWTRRRTRSIEVGAQPARAGRGQGGDDDVVDAEELQRVHRPPCRGRGRRSCPAQIRPAARARSMTCVRRARACARGDAVAALLGHDEDEHVALAARPRFAFSASSRPVEAAVRLATDERDVEGQALLVEVDDDVLDRAGRVASRDALDEVAAQPARRRRRVGRDDDLVGVVLGDRVHRGGVGVGVADLADRRRCPPRAGSCAPGRCAPARRRRRPRRR